METLKRWVIAWIGRALWGLSGPLSMILSYIVQKIGEAIVKVIKRKEADDKIEKEEKAVAEKVDQAKTEKERENAAKDSLDDLF